MNPDPGSFTQALQTLPVVDFPPPPATFPALLAQYQTALRVEWKPCISMWLENPTTATY